MFAALALLVTMAGITGVIATSVSQRTQEFGLRMALGASRQAVLRMVVGQGLVLVLIGLVVGVVASVAATRVLATYLFDTKATDPLTFVVVGVAFLIAGGDRLPRPCVARDDGRSDAGAAGGVRVGRPRGRHGPVGRWGR